MAVGLRALPARAQRSTLPWACLVLVSPYRGAQFHFQDAGMVEVAASAGSSGSCGPCLEDTVTIEGRLHYPASQLAPAGISAASGLGLRYDGADSSEVERHRHTECAKETSRGRKCRGQCYCEGDTAESDNIEQDLGTVAGTCLVRRELLPRGLLEEAIAAFCSRELWNSDPCRSCLVFEAYDPVWQSS
jgi:hypothetical protein